MSGRFTSEQLKKLAMGSMLLDHAAVTIIFGGGLNESSLLMENIGIAMRLIGRMAFPLYAFMLVQGFMWTHDWKKYVARMAVFALVSEIPFNLMFVGEVWYSYSQNTIVTLLIGLICMKMLEVLERKFGNTDFSGKCLGAGLAFWCVAMAIFAAELLSTDYGAIGVFLIVVLYILRHRPMEMVVAGCLSMILIYGIGFEVLFAWIAFFFISRYNGERGRKLGMMPYVFYPAHLLAVWLAGAVIAGI